MENKIGNKKLLSGVIALIAALALLLGLTALDRSLPAAEPEQGPGESAEGYAPGTYTGQAEGFGGPVSVTLTA